MPLAFDLKEIFMKKKLLCIALSIFAVFTLSACGDVNDAVPPEDDVPEAEAATETGAMDKSTLLLDENDVKITYKGINYDGKLGTEVKLLIENNSVKSYIIQSDKCSVNGFMIQPMFSPEIAADKKINDKLLFTERQMEENSISEIETIELQFKIFSSEDWMDSYETETVTINCK